MAKILIVEDHPDIRQFVTLLLAPYGHEIVEAENGQQAMELAVKQHPDLILMDLSIPVLSGWDATRQIKANPATADIPVVALTAHAMKGDRERAREAGCDGFITKPIDDELLEHTVDQILSERQKKKAKTGMVPNELASIISQMATGLVIIDAEGTVSLVNRHGLEILAVTLDALSGVKINDLAGQLEPRTYDGKPMDPSEFPLQRALKKGETVSKQLIRVRTRHGGEPILRFNAAPIYNESGQKIGAVGVFEDVTEEMSIRQQLANQKRELERANAQLRQLDQLKSRFSSTIAHELRTPLTAISGMITLLERNTEQFTPELQDVINRLQSNVQYLNNMLNDLLDYSHIVAGKEVIKVVPFAPQKLIGDVCDSLLETARGRGLQLRVELDEELPVEVISDPIKCRQVLTNLVSNAIKYTEKGEVLIEARPFQHGRFWLVDVKDTGIGISAEELDHIFDEFHRAGNCSTTNMGGTGLGLAISKRIVELMGGRIEVESEVGRGSRFTVVWPSNIAASMQAGKAK